MGIYVIFIAFALLSYLVAGRLRSKFEQYSQMSLPNGMSGKEIAMKMLNDHGIYDVKVISVPGELTDHYHPVHKTVNLSDAVFNGRNISAAAVAAHECGHAVQHARSYAWLQMRSTLVPVVSVSSRYLQWVLLAGVILINITSLPLAIGVVLFGLTTLFSFITLPVEFDASKRGLAWLNQSGIARGESLHYAKDALQWAAYTYVIAALQSLATLVYYGLMLLGRRRN